MIRLNGSRERVSASYFNSILNDPRDRHFPLHFHNLLSCSPSWREINPSKLSLYFWDRNPEWLPQAPLEPPLLLLLLPSLKQVLMMFSWVLEAKTPAIISLITSTKLWLTEAFAPSETINSGEEKRSLQNSWKPSKNQGLP